MSVVRLMLIAAVAALGTVPALAQQETGTRIGGRPSQDPNYGSRSFRARMWLQNYASCIFGRDPKEVTDILNGSLEYEQPLRKLTQTYDECLSSGGGADELRMSTSLLLGALYADRVTRTVQDIPATSLSTDLLAVAANESDSSAAKARIPLLRFGECVMRQDPESALAYVRADAGSTLETKALTSLAPLLGACIDEGSTVEVSRSILEAALAEAIYRTVNVTEAAE